MNTWSRVVAAAALAVVACRVAAAEPPAATTTPIQHLIVIFQENVSFDHYFATYPVAVNPPGEPRFHPRPGTPAVNGLSGPLLHHNPNAAPPFRLARSQAATCDMDHDYTAEQKAADGGLMDRFVEETGPRHGPCKPEQVMGYFDGNTVTALWNYAQHFAMSDNHFGTTFGPSAVGALNLVSGQTANADVDDLRAFWNPLEHQVLKGTLIGDAQPRYDDCAKHGSVGMRGRNVGNLLNAKGVTWGWFEGGFRPSKRGADGKAVCGTSHSASNGKSKADYLPHHEPFQYYPSTANPHHLPPSSVAMIGKPDQANHQYDLQDFWAAADARHLPAVSFLKAPAYQDGHAGYSDPLAEQVFLVETLNRLQRLPEWRASAVIIAYDDSDGWYDHVMPPIVNHSSSSADALTGRHGCGQAESGAYPARCGYGPRLPLLVISPYAKRNFVDHSVTDQSSILRFIEDNWRLGRIGDQSFDAKAGSLQHLFDFTAGPRAEPLFLAPDTGEVVTPKASL